MESLEQYEKILKKFKNKNRLEIENDSAAVTLHLMNQHRVDQDTAMDQSSRGGDDKGVDGWFFDEKTSELFIYQSKFSEYKQYVVQGFADIVRAKNWIEEVFILEVIEKVPNSHGLYNLYMFLASSKSKIRKIVFVLLSCVNDNWLEDSIEYGNCRDMLSKSKLADRVLIDLRLSSYNLTDTSIPKIVKSYSVTKFSDSTLTFGTYANLDLGYIPLIQLVELYRQRGYVLFDKNIRLSIANTKEARERLVHPMEETLAQICEGKLEPSIFTFYHVGVTIAASKGTSDRTNLMLESPSIINGCQTITIAETFLKNLEKSKIVEKINRFKEIKVIAKIVIGVKDDELREITNSNNRQNPIDNWQLFSNDIIHIEIEQALEAIGVFYERQKGKFFTVMNKTQNAMKYRNTYNTFITVPDLGQIVCLSRRNLQWAAKPSEIFLNKKSHDSVFNSEMPRYAEDSVLVTNAFKAMKRALKKVIDNQPYANEDTTRIFSKPIVRAFAYYLALMRFYQDDNPSVQRDSFTTRLYKIAPSKLVSYFEKFFPKMIPKTRSWYMSESQKLQVEVSWKKIDEYLDTISVEIGVNLKSSTPFTKDAIKWSDLMESDDGEIT